MIEYKTTVEILDINLNRVCVLTSLLPINNEGDIIQYSKELSDYGTCKFRISTQDPVFTTYGDVFYPHKYHVRIIRGNYKVWHGAIVANPRRNSRFIEVEAAEYEYYLDRVLVTRSSPDENGNANIFRQFKSGTMAENVTTIMNETKAKFAGSVHALRGLTLGTIENPDFPPQMVTDYIADGATTGAALTGPWTFGTGTVDAKGPEIDVDFHTILYILKIFGMYGYCDFEIDDNLVFHFKKFVGKYRNQKLKFEYGPQGNVIDYNMPRDGKNMTNSLYTIATDPFGVILHVEKTDEASIKEFGLLEGVAAYSDIKSTSLLNDRAVAELPLISRANESNITVYINENGYPLGMYDIGDLIGVKVNDNGIDFDGVRRIVGITVSLHETGRERIAVQTNQALPWQMSEA